LNAFFSQLRARLLDETGNNMVEYALLLALLCTGVTAGVDTAGASIGKAYSTISSDVSNNIVSPTSGSGTSGGGASSGGNSGGKSGGGKSGGGKSGGGKSGGGKSGGKTK
jgi:Flp pilus assembly pilin Flp